MSVYAINNPLSNGYGVNVQQLRKKLEEAKNPTLLDTLDNSSSSSQYIEEKIEQFFKDNPQLAERYGQIQTLNKLEEARSSGLQNISDTIDTTSLVSYMNRMGGTSSALAMTGEGSLAALLNTGFKLTV